MDDVLCMRNGGVDKLNEFLEYLNTLYPSIRFTLENGGTSINFLDMNIDISDGIHHAINFFRKPTATETTIPSSLFT